MRENLQHGVCYFRQKKKTSSSPFFASLMSVGTRDEVKWVTLALKWVIFSFTVARQKTTKKVVRRAKDWRVIAPRKTASAGRKSSCERTRFQRKQAFPTPPSVRDCQEGMEEETEGRLQGENGLPRC